MKFKSLISYTLLIFTITFSYTQTPNNPWSLGFGVNTVGLMNESNIESEMGFGFHTLVSQDILRVDFQLVHNTTLEKLKLII